eukprot:TRINITY_DN883_c0_g1_i2.p1 TRINITY_DN883_c0_g1~~TRINITY_DN883_c0_g1_i2.p1  ORF type:complete len:343 (-),score=32.37 TRINITY_DN883_c0_g1_i2:1814-2842(-)
MQTSVPQYAQERPLRSKLSSARIASLLPGFTDIINEFEESSRLVAVTHECTVLAPALCVTNTKISVDGLESTHIAAGWNATFSLQHRSMKELLSTHTCSFYRINVPSLVQTKPTLLLTHLKPPKTELDPSEEEIEQALQRIMPGLIVISGNPVSLTGIFDLYQRVGCVLDSPTKALSCIAAARVSLQNIRTTVNYKLPDQTKRPRVSVVQWTDPLYLAGDWVPSVVELSAQLDKFVTPGSPSVSVAPSSLREVDIIIFALCALSRETSERFVRRFYESNEDSLSTSHVKYIITDATTLFSRPSLLKVVDTAQVVAEIVMDNSHYGMKGRIWHEWKPLAQSVS